ncbi:hypothetical protein IRJ41_018083 [Triplophysa rosa]|uniref:Uncharacterized protein n=1 Tax=Triplophysa rosa TaxID=992332 RepID=A0A9W7TTW1_TRIRA|nr:hypothetical protein IRJ41_018083 [Triplophysa rosa]
MNIRALSTLASSISTKASCIRDVNSAELQLSRALTHISLQPTVLITRLKTRKVITLPLLAAIVTGRGFPFMRPDRGHKGAKCSIDDSPHWAKGRH